MSAIFIGKNSKVFKALKPMVFDEEDVEVSHSDNFRKVIEDKNISKAALFSWSKNMDDNVSMLVGLRESGITSIYFMSTSAASYPNCIGYSYVKNKLIAEQFIVSSFDTYSVVKAGLIEGTHDFSRIHGNVPMTKLSSLADSIASWKHGARVEAGDVVSLFENRFVQSESIKIRTLFKLYSVVNCLPRVLSRPFDLAFKILGYSNYGYLYRQLN